MKHLIRFKRTYFALTLSLTVLLIWQCAVNPVTGKRELMLVSEQQEIAMGAEYDPEVVSTYGMYNDPKLQTYVEKMGNEMAAVSHRPDLEFHFRVLDSPVINAFAVPGGYVYITRGIMAYLNSEAEFAGVLGHEIGHVTARHSAKQMSKQQIAQLGLGLGMVFSETFAQFAGLASSGLQLAFLKMGRDAERESDGLGIEYSTKIGYDAMEMSNFFVVLERMNPGGGAMPSWMSTHPLSSERIQNIQSGASAYFAEHNINESNLKINRDAWLNLIDGIIFGDDPKHGYVEAGVFYHPDMKFYFPVPANWKVINTPSQVQMGSPDDKAAMVFTLSKEATAAAAASAFGSQEGATVLENSPTRVSGFQAVKLLTDIASQQGALRVQSYFIEFDGKVVVFHGYSTQADFPAYQAAMVGSMGQFNRLTDAAKINVL
nr:M48 family metalloprotease [Calditrichia bacterium]